jgi:hypothetical protein
MVVSKGVRQCTAWDITSFCAPFCKATPPWRWRQQGPLNSEVLVSWHNTCCQNPEDHDMNLHHCENLKSHTTDIPVCQVSGHQLKWEFIKQMLITANHNT